MDRLVGVIMILVLTLSVAAAQDKGGDKSDTPAEQYKSLQRASGTKRLSSLAQLPPMLLK